MYRKKVIGFVVLLFLLETSSAFLADKCNIDIDFGQFFDGKKVSKQDLLNGAAIFAEVFHEKSELSQKFPLTQKLVNDLVKYGAGKITTAYLAHVGTAVYLGAVIVTSYCYLVHSRKLLAEIQSIDYKLNLVIDQEVLPVLQAIETVLNEGKQRQICDKKMEVMKLLNKRIDKIQLFFNDIKDHRNQAIEGEAQSECFQIVIVIGAVIGIAVAAPIVAPSVIGVSVVVGMFGVAGTFGQNWLSKSKENYQKSLRLLDRMEDKAKAAERALTMLNTKIEVGCIFDPAS